ncbi:hypothetical protein [Flavobacterium sp.]|uniref:hypothetical protein n=1 Tax=Flavobacterium sp. TaxID=239 RepID=UPI003527CCD6
MNLHEFSYDKIEFGIAFPFYGGYWRTDLKEIIKMNINPNKFEEDLKEASWDYTVVDFNMQKDNISFKLEINEYDDISLILMSEPTKESKQKLREWATIIAEEIEKLKK